MTIKSGPEYGLYLLSCMVADKRIADADVRLIVKVMSNSYVDGVPDEAQRHKAQSVVDLLARTWPRGARSGIEEPSDDWASPTVTATADEIILAHKKATGQTVTELPPVGSVARSIILADVKRRNEMPPGGKL